ATLFRADGVALSLGETAPRQQGPRGRWWVATSSATGHDGTIPAGSARWRPVPRSTFLAWSHSMTERNKISRRGFLGTSGAAAGAVAAAGAFPHPAVGRIQGANERLNFGMIGCGGRMNAHLKV